MYNLIITIVAIALTVAATAAAMFYGGDTLTQGRDRADAAAFVTGGQQIIGAIQMFAATEGEPISDLDDLIDDGYLNGYPVVKGSAWTLKANDKQVESTVTSDSVCEAINKQAGVADAQAGSVETVAGLFGCINDNNTFVIKY